MYWTTPSGTRYQIGWPAALPLAAVGGGDGQRRDLQHRHPLGRDRAQRRGVHLGAGPGAPDEVGELEQLVGVAPGEDLGQRVGAGDEVEVGVGMAARRSRSVSTVYVGPPRSMSTRLTP